MRNGLLTSEVLVKHYLERIKILNPQLNAFITITEDLALETAATLDAELKSGDRGPLHGIPIVLKDNIDTAGIKTSVGSQYFRNRLPKENASVIQRLQAAGVVLLGKTNMDEFASGILGKQYRAAAEQDIFGSTVRSNLDSGEKISQATYEQAQIIKQRQTVQLKKVFGTVDALLTPTMPIVAPLLTGSIYECRQFMLPFSFTGVPAVSIPCGFSADGLPIGLQIIGNHFEEALILRIAAAIAALSR